MKHKNGMKILELPQKNKKNNQRLSKNITHFSCNLTYCAEKFHYLSEKNATPNPLATDVFRIWAAAPNRFFNFFDLFSEEIGNQGHTRMMDETIRQLLSVLLFCEQHLLQDGDRMSWWIACVWQFVLCRQRVKWIEYTADNLHGSFHCAVQLANAELFLLNSKAYSTGLFY